MIGNYRNMANFCRLISSIEIFNSSFLKKSRKSEEKKMERKDKFEIDASKISCNIENYFSKSEWEEMSDYEKKHLQNVKSNYEALLLIGLFPEKPLFMRSAKEQKKFEKILEKDDSDDDDDDEEWLPSYKKKRPSQFKTKVFINPKPKVETPKIQFQKRKQVKTIPDEIIPRALREKPSICMSLEVPADDSFIYCEDCNEEYFKDCPTHGPLITIKDTEVKIRSKYYAERTAPVCVTIKDSEIENAGLGAFAKEPIPNRIRFGPYRGEITKNEDKAQISGYSWQIYTEGKASHFIDAHNPMTSNWMRFVNCARNEEEQNLTAFQFMGEIYYKTLRPILRGEELLVWYGEEYAKDLGICISESNKYEQKKETLLRKEPLINQLQTLSPKVQDNLKEKENSSLLNLKENIDKKMIKKENIQNLLKTEKYTQPPNIDNNKIRKTFTEKHDVNDDMKIHTGEKPFQCEKCLKTFTQKGHLDLHIKIHTGEKPFQCEKCLKTFIHKGALNLHMRIHTGEKPFQCEKCLKTFTQKGHLDLHIKIHTGEKPFQCEKCLKTFIHKGALNLHMRIHTGEKPFQCEKCLKTFTQKGSLDLHMKIHTGEKPFQCEKCLKTFTRKDHLDLHMKIHTGEKPFQCEKCLKTFTLKCNLNLHMMLHTGEKPFQCEKCLKTFIHKGNLNLHMMLHTGEKPFQCEKCLKTFREKGVLNKHMRIHTGEKPFQCEKCLKTFTQKSNLNRHMKIHNKKNSL